jgi:hypothetical protein
VPLHPSCDPGAVGGDPQAWSRVEGVLAATGPATRSAVSPDHLHAEMLDVMWQPAVPAGHAPWEEAAGMGWFLGTYQGRRTVSHSGADPGFGSKLILVPEERTGVVVQANSNTAPTDAVARAALDLALGVRPDQGSPPAGKDSAHLSALLPPVVGKVAAVLTQSGTEAAVAAWGRLASAQRATVDLDDERFVDGVWGAIELHRTDLVWPLLRLWTTVRPESSQAWTMT